MRRLASTLLAIPVLVGLTVAVGAYYLSVRLDWEGQRVV